MKIWTVANQKGGVGKTTTAVSLAGILALQGKRVLLIDTDPHASLTYYFGIDSEDLEVSVYDIFARGTSMQSEEILQALCPSTMENLDILPATMAIATLDRSMGNKTGMGLILKKTLAKISEHYDYALLDCPPVLGVLMVNALAASERILVPVQTEFLALKGLDRMVKTMILMGRSKKIQYSYTIVPTMFDKRTRAATAALQQLNDEYKNNLWSDVIPVDTKFRDASLSHLPASHFAPRSRGVKAYDRLIKYLLAKDFSHVKIG